MYLWEWYRRNENYFVLLGRRINEGDADVKLDLPKNLFVHLKVYFKTMQHF